MTGDTTCYTTAVRFEPAPSSPAHLDVLDGVAVAAFRTASFRDQLRWRAVVEPAGLFQCVDDGRVVGAASAISYPDAGFGWIGMVATLPSHERRGIGRRLTELTVEYLTDHGCASVLDASAAGAPVYRRMGFVDLGATSILGHDGSIHAPAGLRAVPCTDAHVDAVVALDRAAFGVDRSALVRAMLADEPSRTSVVVGRHDEPVGFAVAQSAAIGPIVAPDRDVLAALVHRSLGLPWDAPPRVAVPPGATLRPDLIRLGFAPLRELRHMALGIDSLPTDRDTYAVRVGVGFG